MSKQRYNASGPQHSASSSSMSTACLARPAVHVVHVCCHKRYTLQEAHGLRSSPCRVQILHRFTPASSMPPLLPSASAACSLDNSKRCHVPQETLPAELKKMLYATRHIMKFCCLNIQGSSACQEAAKKTTETATPQRYLLSRCRLVHHALTKACLWTKTTAAAHWPFMSCPTHTPPLRSRQREHVVTSRRHVHSALYAVATPGATPSGHV